MASSRTSSIPVIVLSGSGTGETPDQVKALGADAFLVKPVDPDALYQVLRSTLGQT